MTLLAGLHDREAAPHVPAGGWCLDTVALSELPQPPDYAALAPGVNWIVRMNWGYGEQGTIPFPIRDDHFAELCANYALKSRSVRYFIIGNEPNHENERPGGHVITPLRYAEVFRKCRAAIKQLRADAQVIPAPCAPYHADPVNWLDYWQEMLRTIESLGGCDALAIHAYVRGGQPADIHSVARMGPPLQNQFSGFFTYRDALGVVPPSMRRLPVFVTEFNPLLPEGWPDANTGLVQAAYAEIDWWNHYPGAQQIHALILYRWSKHDKWHIEGKQSVIDDFRAAVARGFTVPAETVQAATSAHTLNLPKLETPKAQPASHRIWDMRLGERGVKIETPSDVRWVVTMGRWMDETESQGRHHIYVDVKDEAGNRVPGVRLLVEWPGGSAPIVTEAKPGEPYSGNFPMSASLNEFAIRVDDGQPSERVTGIGMGAYGNAGIHTSTVLHFQRVALAQPGPAAPTLAPSPTPLDPPRPVPAPGSTQAQVPSLVHPIADPALRVISQGFGENPAVYARWGWAGHNGVDFAVPEGTVIRAVDGGTIVENGDDPEGYGMYVKIRHPWGESLYAHLSFYPKSMMGIGVLAGCPIGRSGNTGFSTGPHLHLGIRVNPYTRGAPFDGYTDPLPLLRRERNTDEETVRQVLDEAAAEFGVRRSLLASLAWAESSFDVGVVSEAGAVGLLQLMPATWGEWSAKVGAFAPNDPRDNARVGAAYLAWLIQTAGSEHRALIAYNWGIGNLLQGKRPPAETLEFANKVIHGADLVDALTQ